MKTIKLSLFATALLFMVSCGKKENEENFGAAKDEVATEEVTAEADATEIKE